VKKKTPTQKYIDMAVKKAVDAISTIAEGLVENAVALGKLAEVLKASNVTIEPMIKIEG